MNRNGQKPVLRGQRRYLVLPLPMNFPLKIQRYGLLLAVVVGSNMLTHMIWNPDSDSRMVDAAVDIHATANTESLYLSDKAAAYIPDTEAFADKVQNIAEMLEVPAEWLMAVMYAESKFDPGVANFKGSGAVGLIQFMPTTALDLNVSTERLKRMNPLQQLEYVYLYLQQVRERYGEYDSLTDLYLAILYPKARKQDYCYTLYAKPSKSYQQNSGLDEDKDGRVTISDIDKHMKRLYPTAYMIVKEY